MSESCRNLFLDVLRGVAILIVVLGHSVQSANNMDPSLPFQKIIMTFWMPLFFIISGYVDGISHGGRGVLHKANRLLVPYLFWASVVYFIDVADMKVACSIGSYVQALAGSGFWFLRILFGVWLVVYIGRLAYRLMSSVENEYVRILLAVASIAASAYGLSRFAIFAGCEKFVVCYLVGIVIFFTNNRLTPAWRIAVIMACPLIFSASAWIYLCENGTFLGRMLDLSMAFTGSGVACAITYMIVKHKDSLLCRCIVYCGRTSLEIYAIHWCLLFYTDVLCLSSFVRRGYDVYCVAIIGAMSWLTFSVVFAALVRALPGGRVVLSGFTVRNASRTRM